MELFYENSHRLKATNNKCLMFHGVLDTPLQRYQKNCLTNVSQLHFHGGGPYHIEISPFDLLCKSRFTKGCNFPSLVVSNDYGSQFHSSF